jgi:hypothetical protein
LAAQANLVTYDFRLSVTTGSLAAGADYSGSFSYDTSIIPAGGGEVDQLGLMSTLDFSFGTAYDAANANTGYLTFDSSGYLTDLLLGTHCTAGDCSIGGPPDWRMSWSTASSSFIYADESGNHFGGGPVLTLRSGGGNLPEPATLALVFSAALVAYGTRRRA